MATTRDGHLITGVPRISRDKKLLNSAILVNNNGDFIATYDKRHLVPFGEYIPFRNILPSINAIVGPVDFASGQRGPLMTLANYGRVSVLICYEIIFSGSIVEPVNRPEIIINITNDAWFGESAGPWQHFFQARFRAVEEGLPLLRVANTGISVGFDGHGRQLGIIPLGHRAAIDVEVPEALAPTLFAQFGNMFFFGLLLVIGTVAVSVDVSRSIRH